MASAGSTFQREFGQGGAVANAATNAALVAVKATADLALAQSSAALGPVRASTTAAQADGTLANSSYYYIPSASTSGALDLYLKVSNAASTYIKTVANDVQVAANTSALARLNETTSALAFLTSPPITTDAYTEVFTT